MRLHGIGALGIAVLLALLAAGLSGSGGCAREAPKGGSEAVEITEYDGVRLDPYFREYDNSIQGPQSVDPAAYRLEVAGLVERPLSLTYEEVLALPKVTRAITLYCVEGWSEHLLFEGVRVADVIGPAGRKGEVTTVVLYAADGYSTSLPYGDVARLDLMLASSINGRVLDELRGFPFQLVAQSKLGYKWIKWVTRIELSDKPFSGYWEQRGYSNDADVPKAWLEGD